MYRRFGVRIWAMLSVSILWWAAAVQGVEVNGNQAGTWARTQSPYVVTGWVTIPVGQSLTIEPGVVVTFNNRQGISVDGTLNATGTSAANIVFTANGSSAPSSWNSIQFNEGSRGTLEYCQVRYGGWWESAGVVIRGSAAPTIANSESATSAARG